MQFVSRMSEETETVYCRYKSERETADRNYALAYYMRENKVQWFREMINIVFTKSTKLKWLAY